MAYNDPPCDAIFRLWCSEGSYSLLIGRDWIHANYCVPSTMHWCLIQWHGDDVEMVRADEIMSIATADPIYWELEDFKCFSSKLWKGASLRSVMKANSRSKQWALIVCFNE